MENKPMPSDNLLDAQSTDPTRTNTELRHSDMTGIHIPLGQLDSQLDKPTTTHDEVFY